MLFEGWLYSEDKGRYVPVVGDEQLNVSPYSAARSWIIFATLKTPQKDRSTSTSNVRYADLKIVGGRR